MTTFAMVIDTVSCIGCGDCVVACKNENKVPAGLNRDWVVEATRGEYPNLETEFVGRCIQRGRVLVDDVDQAVGLFEEISASAASYRDVADRLASLSQQRSAN